MRKIKLLLCLLCFIAGTTSYAYDFYGNDGIFYSTTDEAGEEGGAVVTGYDSNYTSTIVLKGTVECNGKEFKIIGIEERAFYGCPYLVKIEDLPYCQYIRSSCLYWNR